MCGIFFQINFSNEKEITVIQDFTALIKGIQRRGPHSLKKICIENASLNIYAASSVLHLRGDQVTPQPLCAKEIMLFWNGEVFGGLHVPDEQNDGTVLMDHLNMIEFIDTSQYFQEVSDLFKKIEGPYAFVLFNTKHQVLIYGRDSLGRRSLLLHNDNTKFCISSVSIKGMGEWKEIPSSQFCLFDVNARKNLDVIEYSKYDPVSFQINHKENPDFKRILFDLLLDSVRKRLVSIPKVENGSRIAILFSGGLDCSILAALVDKCIPSEESVDLINVAFENQRFLRNHPGTAVFDVPDRISGRESLKCIQKYMILTVAYRAENGNS